MLCLPGLAQLRKDCTHAAQPAPAFSIRVQRKDRSRNVVAIMFAWKKAVIAASIENAFNLFFPFWPHRADEIRVARLPVIAGEAVEFLARLIELDCIADKLEERHNQAASVSLITPELQR